MRVRLPAVCILVLLGGLAGAGPDKPKDDRDALQGSWEPIGQPQAENGRLERLTVEGDKLTFHGLSDGERAKAETQFTLDPRARPKAIDFTPTEGANKGKTYLGIYELQDGRLQICYGDPGAPRPKEFDYRPGAAENPAYFVLKRLPAK